MKNQRRNRPCPGMRELRVGAGMLLLGLLAAGTLASCSSDARYRIKTILFTGVPPQGAEQAAADLPAEQQPANVDQQARQQAYREALVPRFWQHGPFAAGECQRCHNLSQSKSFHGTAPTAAPTAATSSPAPSRLTMPKQQLCVTCHRQHSADYASSRGLAQHAPAAAGACTTCHNPHQSLRRYMLLKADNRELCGGCHAAERLSSNHARAAQLDCIDCHNAHVGKTPQLLRSDARELRLLYGTFGND